jgi:hypothetical protein
MGMILEPCNHVITTILLLLTPFLWYFVESTSTTEESLYFPRRLALRDNLLKQQAQEQHASFLSYPLYLGYGAYYAEVFVGSPTPQRQTLLVDTGSYITAFPCEGCRSLDCDPFQDHLDPVFVPNMSSTYEQPHCPNGCIWASCYDDSTPGDEQPQQQQQQQEEDSPCTINNYYSEGKDWKLVEGNDWLYLSVPLKNNETSEKGEQQIITPQIPSFKLSFACMIHTTFSQGAMERHLADGVMVRLYMSASLHAGEQFRYQLPD